MDVFSPEMLPKVNQQMIYYVLLP